MTGIHVNVINWLNPANNSINVHQSSNVNNLTSKYYPTNYRLKRSISQDSLLCYLKKLQSIKNINEKYTNINTTHNDNNNTTDKDNHTTDNDDHNNTIIKSLKNQFPLINKKFSSCISIFSLINYYKSSQLSYLTSFKEFPNNHIYHQLKVMNERDYFKANIIHKSFIHSYQPQQLSSNDER